MRCYQVQRAKLPPNEFLEVQNDKDRKGYELQMLELGGEEAKERWRKKR